MQIYRQVGVGIRLREDQLHEELNHYFEVLLVAELRTMTLVRKFKLMISIVVMKNFETPIMHFFYLKSSFYLNEC
jgi:hypothetical protein